jgi:hypothetical protein
MSRREEVLVAEQVSGGEAMLSVYPPNPPDYGKCRCGEGDCHHEATGDDGLCSVCRRNQNTFACVFFRHGKPERLP